MKYAAHLAIAMLTIGMIGIGCGSSDDGDADVDEAASDPTIVEPATTEVAAMYAPELNVEIDSMTKTDSGLLYQVLAEGSGTEAESGQTVTVHYTGWLPNGTKFDSSRDRDETFSFPLGAGQVISGWDEGVAGMQVGEQRKLVIPPALGYGASGAGGVIPPNATLVFDVELIGAE